VGIPCLLLKRHIHPVIGHLKLSKIKPAHLNNLYSDMLKSRKDGKEGGYSPATIKRVHALISNILSTAVRWNVLLDNPCERIQPPKQARDINDINFFTLEQTEVFLNALDTDFSDGKIKFQHVVFFQLALFCGLRRGELIALTWSDIDFNAKAINVSKSTDLVNGKPYTKAPRSKSSIRIVSILESVIELLRKYRKEQLEYRLMIGNQWQGDNHVFIQWDGSQMYPSTPYSIFKDIIHRHNTRFGDKDSIRQAGPRTNKHHDEYIQPCRPMH